MGEREELEFGAKLWTEKPASNRSLIWKAILKLILQQQYDHARAWIIRIRIRSLKGCCEHDDELSGYV
jgi:hypothetical protein